MLNAKDAAERGAEILTPARAPTAARREGRPLARHADRHGYRRRARDGPRPPDPGQRRGAHGVDRFLKQGLGRNDDDHLRLVKGSHVIVPRLYEGEHALYPAEPPDRRVIFTIPYERDYTLIGTTDIPYEDDPARVHCTPEEIDYLCDAVNEYFEPQIGPEDVVRTYSGVRPLYDDKRANPSAVTRDYVFDVESPEGGAALLSIYGGKITT